MSGGVWTEILTNEGIVPEVWEAGCSSEYLRQMFWSRFIGGDNAPIQVNEDLTKSAGDRINTAIRSRLIGGRVTGSTPSTGNEGRIDFYNFQQTVDNDKLSAKAFNVDMTQQRAAFNVLSQLRAAIIDERKQITEDRITAALSDTSTGRVRGRYLYGAADANWNATHATALQSIDNTTDKLQLSHVSMCKRKAKVLGGNATAKIRPWKVMASEKDVQEWFIYVNHTYALRDLVNDDPAWKNAMLLIPPISNPNNPIFSGAWFKGGFDGVLIYEFEGIDLVSNGTIQCAHGLLLGAQAAVLAWAQHGKFTEQFEDYRSTYGLEHKEINSIAKVVYDRNTVDSGIANEDNGVVHHFTAAVADA